ncbi:MAG: fimbrillin family protein, partial [Bacteroidetes bacterium]|nr:fimbrillin family protein [Bacteroidota bacterium]
MKKTLLFAIILAMATFSSCSKDEVIDVNRNSDKMSFGAHVGSATKAVVTDATNFTA